MKRSLKKLTAWISMAAMLLSLIPATVVPAVAADAVTASNQAIAVTFSDMNEVEYTEAVSVTGGIGLFAGTDGKFMPKGTVTRAQMATIVVKMLYGANANADSFKGASNPFTDTANFEGGWAEGYINWCYTLGIISGYGDGTFRPGNKVTAAEAVTMILNALKIDAGEGTWPTTVMSKATEVEFFEDLKPTPAADLVLNREQLAVISLNGLNYSTEDTSKYCVVGGSANKDMVFETYAAAQKYANATGGEVANVNADSLAQDVFGLKTFTGFVVDNKATMEEDYTVLKALNGAEEEFNISTELDQIGHYVTVWYKEPYVSRTKVGLTYSLSEAASYVTVSKEITKPDAYKEAFTEKYKLADDDLYVVNGDYTYGVWDGGDYVVGTTAEVGTYVIEDENSLIVGFIAEPDIHTAQVRSISTFDDETIVILSDNPSESLTNDEDNTQFIAYEGIAKEDMVSYVKVRDYMTIISLLETATGMVTKDRVVDGEQTVTIGGVEYTYFGDANNSVAGLPGMLSDGLSLSNSDYSKTFVVYLAPNGKYVGFEEVEGAGFDAAKTVYLLGNVATVAKEGYGTYNKNHYARGINLDGDEVMLLTGVTIGTDKNGNGGTQLAGGQYDEVAEGFYTFKANETSKETKKYELQTIEDFNTVYSKENPIYAVNNIRVDGGYQYTGYLYNGLVSNADTVYLVLDNVDVTDEQPIYANLSIGKINVWVNETRTDVPALVTKNNGAVTILTMVLEKDSNTAASDAVYVSRYCQDPVGVTADGAMYAVYNAETGAEMEVTLKKGLSFPGPGIYSIVRDLETRVVTEVKKMNQYASLGQTADGFKNRGVVYDTEVLSWTGSRIWLANTIVSDYNTANVIVVDPRTDDQIKEADGGLKLARIGSLNDLVARGVLEDDFAGKVKVDVFVDDSSSKRIRTIFISDVLMDTEELTLELENQNTFVTDFDLSDEDSYELLRTDVDKADLYGSGKLFATFDVYTGNNKTYVWVTGIDTNGPDENKQTLNATIDDPKPTPDFVIDAGATGIDTVDAFAANTGNITYNYYVAGDKTAVEIVAVDDGDPTANLTADALSALDLGDMEVRHDIAGVTIDDLDDLAGFVGDADGDGLTDYNVSITVFEAADVVKVNKCERQYAYANWTETSGTVTLNKHYKVNSTIELTGDLTIDLAGRRLELGAAAQMFKVPAGKKLTIKDSGNTVAGVVEEGTILGLADNNNILIDVYGTFNLEGGVITGNKTTTGKAVVHVANATAVMNMSGGKIINNEAKYGAVFVIGTLNMTDGEITGNETNNAGSGIRLEGTGANATITGGKITGNESNNVVLTGAVTLNVGGSVEIESSWVYSGSVNLRTLEPDASIVINSDTSGFSVNTTGAYYYKLSSTGVGRYTYTYSATDNKPVSYTVSYNANGGEGAPANQTKPMGQDLTLSSTVPTMAGFEFKGWATSADGAVAYLAGDTYTYVGETDENVTVTLYAVWGKAYTEISPADFLDMADENGTITLDGWYRLAETLTVSDDLTIDLNGQALTIKAVGNQIVVNASVTLTVKDSVGGGAIAGRIDNNSPLFKVKGNMVLESGTITENNATGNGGAVSVAAGGVFTMNGGTITGCTATKEGGAVYAEAGNSAAKYAAVIINGGTIEDNTADQNGNAISVGRYSKVTVTGGTIDEIYLAGMTSSMKAYVFVSGGDIDAVNAGNYGEVAVSGSAKIGEVSGTRQAALKLSGALTGEASITSDAELDTGALVEDTDYAVTEDNGKFVYTAPQAQG